VAVSRQTYNADCAALGATLARSERYYIDIAGCRVIAVEQICCKLRVNSATVLRFAPNGLRAFPRDSRYFIAAVRFEEKAPLFLGDWFESARGRRLAQCLIHQHQGLFDDIETVAQLIFADNERRTNPQHIEAAEGVKVLGFQM